MDDLFYQIFFGTKETMDYVLSHGPCNFENTLVLVRPSSGVSAHPNLCVAKEYFWILLIGLPHICYTLEVAQKLAKVLRLLQDYPTP